MTERIDGPLPDFKEAEQREKGDARHCVSCGRDRVKGSGKELRRGKRGKALWVCDACRTGREDGSMPKKARFRQYGFFR